MFSTKRQGGKCHSIIQPEKKAGKKCHSQVENHRKKSIKLDSPGKKLVEIGRKMCNCAIATQSTPKKYQSVLLEENINARVPITESASRKSGKLCAFQIDDNFQKKWDPFVPMTKMTQQAHSECTLIMMHMLAIFGVAERRRGHTARRWLTSNLGKRENWT